MSTFEILATAFSILSGIYWLVAIGLLVIGLMVYFSKPEHGKRYLLISGTMILIGGGICGALFGTFAVLHNL